MVKLHLTTNESKELDGSSHGKCHAVGILSVRDIERCSTALHLAGKEREVHVVRSHKVRLISGDDTDEMLKWCWIGTEMLRIVKS